ncbi:MAG: electron transfer flavoprotein subunit alpha/FixB family protein [Haloarculaceae archaeon]
MTGDDRFLVVPESDPGPLVDEARRLAELLDATGDGHPVVEAVATDGVVDPDAVAAARPDELCVLERERGRFQPGAAGVPARVDALATLVAEASPLAVLLPGTPDGNEVAARLARSVRGGGLVDCLLQVREGDLLGARPAYGERAFATYEFERDPVVASLSVDGLSTPDARPADEPDRTTRTVEVADDDGLVREAVLEVPEEDVERATRVVAGGYGLDGPDDFEIIADLAEALGATLGASRPPVDDGWVAYDRQIGVTGKSVDADLYVPCAISGDPYHMGAVEADCVIPVNVDPDARIFEFADLGIVGDAREYVPAISDAIRAARDVNGDARTGDADEPNAAATEEGDV